MQANTLQDKQKVLVSKQQTKKKIKWVNPLKDRTRVVQFIVPNQEHRMAALGSLAGVKWRIKKSLQAILNDFDQIKKPQPGDNLYQYEQDGQDFPLFNSIYRNHIDLKEQTIYIAPFKCTVSKETISFVKKQAKSFFYGANIKIHHFPEKIDMNQFDPMESENGQLYYDAAKMNVFFTKHLPKKTYSIAVITNLLIYNGDRVQTQLAQKWIFGLGSIKDRTSITSFQEVLKKGYSRKKQQGQNQTEFNVKMLSKIINHQLCHTFAMKHCIFYTCLMNGSNGYHQASTKQQHLCPVCLRKLQSQIQFDMAQRYQALGDEKSLDLAQKIKKVVG